MRAREEMYPTTRLKDMDPMKNLLGRVGKELSFGREGRFQLLIHEDVGVEVLVERSTASPPLHQHTLLQLLHILFEPCEGMAPDHL